MTTPTPPAIDTRRCGCCDRDRPAGTVTELSTTPGVNIRASRTLSAARRAGLPSALTGIGYPGRRLLPTWLQRHDRPRP